MSRREKVLIRRKARPLVLARIDIRIRRLSKTGGLEGSLFVQDGSDHDTKEVWEIALLES